MNVGRRQLLAGGVGVLFGGVVVGAGAGWGIDRVTASEGDIGEFSIGDVETTLGGAPESVELVVEGEIEWDNHEWIDEIEAQLYLAHDGVEEPFGKYVVFDPDASGSQAFELSRDMLTHSALGGDDFDVDPDETDELEFEARLEVVAFDDGGSEEELSTHTDTFVIEVTGEGIFLSVVATGSVTINE